LLGQNLSTHFDLLPAVDVIGGQAVRPVGGVVIDERTFGNPLDIAREFQQSGAEWIHLVDLDAALSKGSNSELLHQIIDVLDIDVELSGGIFDEASLKRATETKARRIVLSTAALADMKWVSHAISQFGDRIAVGLDVDGRTLSARGGKWVGGDVFEAIEELDNQGCARYVVTDKFRDGAMQGPNLELLEEITSRTSTPVVASGGVAQLSDISALTGVAGVEGAIIGKALYAGAFTIEQALGVIPRAE
jgi:1-(5-phosphoribosyl)-5-[(5-phosphoribosylamino)methylideneamino] imidazole-4-carboxamide isomerase/N-(5'phosphoribosyl)anthranilate isomerase